MVMWLKQSVAISVVLGPFVDNVDGVSLETGLTISQADVRLSKNAGAFAQKNSATACTHLENGHYACPLSTTDTGTLGALDIVVNESGALVVRQSYMVVTANVWDSMFGADRLQVDVQEMSAGVITEPSIATGAFTAAKYAAGALTAATFAADVPFLKASHTGTAQAGAATSITLAAGASAVTDYYKDGWVMPTGGTGAGQPPRLITAYNGSSKVATTTPAWATNPASGTTYAIVPAAYVAGIIGGITGNLTGNVTGNVNGNLLGNVNGNVVGTIGDLTATAKASVNAEVVDAVNVDTYAELAQGAPPAATSIRRMVQYVYVAFRNKVVTDASGSPTTIKHYADDGTTVLFKSSATTVGQVTTRDEHTTGP
jgi:hypothetical protein